MRRIIVLLSITILISFVAGYGFAQDGTHADATELFSQANKTYQEAETGKDLNQKKALFQKSAEMYEQIIKSGFTSGPVYYNLGNSYLRLGKRGKAIVNYLRAQNLIPRNEDLKANLGYAREHLQVAESGLPDTIKSMLFFHFTSTLDEEAWILIAFYLLCGAFIVFYIFWRVKIFKWFYMITGIIALCLIVSLAIRIYEAKTIERGVVISKCQIRSAPSPDMPALIEIPEGTDVIIQEDKSVPEAYSQERVRPASGGEGWFKIYIDKDKKGWVLKSDIEGL